MDGDAAIAAPTPPAREGVAVAPLAAAAGGAARHLAAFDGIRFGCALVVMAYHYTATYRAATWATPFGFGFLGVDAFFIISGFFISMTADGRGAGAFAWARVVRLVPAFWTCCGITACVAAAAGEHVAIRRFLLNLTMVPTLFGAAYLDGVYWTIACEIAFYTLVVAVLAAGRWASAERIAYGWLALTACCTPFAPHAAWTALTIKGYSPYFVAGALLWRARCSGLTRARSAGLAAALALSIVAVHVRPETRSVPWLPTALVIAAIYAVLAYAALGGRPVHSRALRLLGAASYPLYLLHQRIGDLALAWLRPTSSGSGIGVMIALGGVMIVAAIVVHLVVERPLQAVLKALARGGGRSQPALDPSRPPS